MPRRKIVRDPVEEASFKRQRQDKKNASQRTITNRRKKLPLDPKVQRSARIIDLENLETITLDDSDVVNKPSTQSQPITEPIIRLDFVDLPSTSSDNAGTNPLRRDDLQKNLDDNGHGHEIDSSLQHNYQQSSRNNNSPILSHSTVDEENVNEDYLGPMIFICSHCNARHFFAEQVANKKHSYNDCCNHGEVALGALPDTPPPLKNLFEGIHEKSNHFFERIRYYNSSFSFASFNANLTQFRNRRPGPFCFKIQGQIYYQINESLYPAPNEVPTNGQLFIIDAAEASQFRCDQNDKLDFDVISIIESVIREHNIFVHSYQMMKDELHATKVNDDDTEPELQLLFTLKKGMDRGRYNFQRTNEVAAVFATTADGDIPESYVTIRNKNTKELKTVSTMDPNVEPWIYPLLYPYGTQGWHKDILLVNKNKHVTRNAYIKYRMAIRDDFNIFLMGRRLFQQWVVDNYVKIEKDRIMYCKNNQKKLRAESYQGLIDHLHRKGSDTNRQIGKIIILPSTFVNSPRNMVQHYQDAMCIVRVLGTPDLFVTMTCNPQWREILENLLPGQTAADRPDIVARVFYLKVKQLMDIIVKQNHFGKVKAFVYVIEYQKRGLPHVHLLVTLDNGSKITTAEQVNKFISAEIPDPQKNPILHQIVIKNMIHGPCGDWCLVDNKCSKKYPKPHLEETVIDENGYPYYRRRDTNKSYSKSNNFIVDNRNVVPHNKKLLKLLNCHINVEIVSSIKAVKYLYKYIYKGHDAAAVNVVDQGQDGVIEHDEIQDYIEGRYVGPVEACWRILNKELQNKSHTVIRLPVHLPNEHTVTLDPENDDSIQNALERQTMLIDYFALNARDPDARNFFYGEIPIHYVFKKKEKNSKTMSWIKRQKRFNAMGRMYSISPTQTELFHLRLLLINVKGAISFTDLKTVDGTVYQTFVAACLALGLIEDDNEWDRTLSEAEVWMMPVQLRKLFVRILLYCNPTYPEKLWDKFKHSMSEDFLAHFEPSMAYKKTYTLLNDMLMSEGSGLNKFPSMEPLINFEMNQYDEMTQEEHQNLGHEQYVKLNELQKEIVDTIMNSTLSKNTNANNLHSNCFYIDGPGGSGKTFIYTTLYHLLRGKKQNVCTMAFTGIAATLLPHGRTVHKVFGMPVPLYDDSTSNIKTNTQQYDYLKNVDIIIWDEAPMAPRYALELVNRTLSDFCNNNRPFGGKIVVLGGDFRQLLPVKMNATRNESVNLSIKFSRLWNCFEKFSLTQNMRALPEETAFAEFILSVGNGTINDENDYVNLPEHCIAPVQADIVMNTYADTIKNKRYDDFTKLAILSPRNADVDSINDRVVGLLDAQSEKLYSSVDSTNNCDNGVINESILIEYLNSINPPNFPPHNLKLRLYSVVMLIRNLCINEGLCNGTRLMVLQLGCNLLTCRILTGDKTGEIVFINRITLYYDHANAFTFKRRQFPVRLAFAMTINKAQGQTFDKIGVDLQKSVFNHGQLYVAMSRVRSWDSLKIYLNNDRTNDLVKNYVYPELYK